MTLHDYISRFADNWLFIVWTIGFCGAAVYFLNHHPTEVKPDEKTKDQPANFWNEW